MPPILDTPSKGSAARFQGRDRDVSAVDGLDVARIDAGPSNVDGHGSQSLKKFELLEDPSFWKDHSVQVIIRVRPLNSTEISLQGTKKCVRQDTCQSITWTGHPESRFTFDLVADEYVTQEKIFKVAGVPMVDNCVSGYNSCMFAYGQTGSGKTHTMLGDIEGGTRRHSVNCGMTPRVFEYLFTKIQKEKEVRREEKLQFVCKCSFLEIYNEHILDLLDPNSSNLQIREDLKKGVYVENLSEFEVASARDIMQHLLQGSTNRKVAATNMNRASSRSHSVFTCVIESKWESQGITHHRFSRLNLVDLAGSERQKSSGAEGERLKEATNINKSLSTLGLVIMNLVGVSNKKSLHIPYRDSKLTFLLQDSLGGNSKTTIIANISPSNCCSLETLSTLKFAQRAKFIRNNAIVNEEASGDVFTMRLEIQQLKKEVSRLQGLLQKNGDPDCRENEDAIARAHGSPSYFNWEGFQGSFSPLAVDKKFSKKRDFEAALAAAFRREMEKERALKAMAAEKEAAELLANQMAGEVNGLKMRIRFREDGIKRLQAVVSGKLASDSHLVQEKEELLKEIEILRNQVECNPKVTSFAMENLRLKEQVRRLESFVDEGERETMNQQINDLEEKLLEALDWKLMHEKNLGFQDLSQSWDSSSLSEENEFLRLQAIQNENEVETLRKNLSFCMEVKENLVRRVEELTLQVEEAAASRERDISRDEHPHDDHDGDDHRQQQEEIKAMVDAIAAASQREAEAHEMAILLSRENEELRSKLALLVDDNNKLILLYESAVSQKLILEREHHSQQQYQEENDLVQHNKTTNEAEDLQAHVHDLQEENERLMGLYETAMQERDEFKKTLLLLQQERQPQEEEGDKEEESVVEPMVEDPRVEVEEEEEEKQIAAKLSGETVDMLGEVLEEIRRSEEDLRRRQQEISSLRTACRETECKRKMAEERLLLLLQKASSFELPRSADSFELERKVELAETELHFLVKLAAEKTAELGNLLSLKEEAAARCKAAAELEAQLRAELTSLKAAYRDAEEQRKETKKVLFSIENRVPAGGEAAAAPPVKTAFELLKAAEELPKLTGEMKRLKEKILAAQASGKECRLAAEELEGKVRSAERAAAAAEEGTKAAEAALREARNDKERAATRLQEGSSLAAEAWEAAVEFQESVFMTAAKEEELRMCEEELVDRERTRRLESLLKQCRAATHSLHRGGAAAPAGEDAMLR